MPGASRGVRRQFWGILVSRALGSAFQALALVLLARTVTPSVFGMVNVVIAVVGFVLVVTGLGMSIFVPWARARQAHGDVAAALRLNTLSNLASAVMLVPAIVVWAHVSGAPLAVALIGVSLALERNVDTWLGVPVADGESRVAVLSALARRTVCLVVLGLVLLAGADPVLGFTGGLVLGALVGQLHVRRAVRLAPAEPTPVREVLGRAAPFLVSNVTGQARTLDVPIVAFVGGPIAAGVYAAATKLVQPVLLVPQALSTVLVPHATRLDVDQARRLGARTLLALLGAAVLGTPLVLLRDEVVVLVLGEQYRDAGATFAVALVAVGCVAWAVSVGAILQGQGRQRVVAWLGAGFAVLLLAGVAIGTYLGGPVGAAAGLALAWFVYAVTLAALLASPVRTNASGAVGPPG